LSYLIPPPAHLYCLSPSIQFWRINFAGFRHCIVQRRQ
jgi:hypothetical protein